jgi:hypothetical protein
VTHREVRDEALTGEPAGQPLSSEIETPVQSADPQATWKLSSKSKHDCDLARRPQHELLPSSSDELSLGAAHSRSCASGNTLAPAGITHRLYFQGCADREWLPPIKLGNVNSFQRASA